MGGTEGYLFPGHTQVLILIASTGVCVWAGGEICSAPLSCASGGPRVLVEHQRLGRCSVCWGTKGSCRASDCQDACLC
jgi:hypothetical protein